jgi:hypothetical protein
MQPDVFGDAMQQAAAVGARRLHQQRHAGPHRHLRASPTTVEFSISTPGNDADAAAFVGAIPGILAGFTVPSTIADEKPQ